jgi:hypothetical protein
MVRAGSVARRTGVVAALGMIGAVGVPVPWAVPPPASATPSCTVSWVNPAGGQWDDGTSWSGGKMPTPADDVCIDHPGTYKVILAGATEIASLTVGGTSGTQTLSVTERGGGPMMGPASLQLNGPSTVTANGVLEVDGDDPAEVPHASSVRGVGPVVNHGRLRLLRGTGSPRSIEANLTNAADGRVEVGSAQAMLNGPLTTNDGTITVEAGASMVLFGGSFTSNPGSRVELAGSMTGRGVTFNQSGGTVSGGPVRLTDGSTLVDSAGPGSFVLSSGWETTKLRGTIPVGQTVTVEHGDTQAVHVVDNVVNNGTLELGGEAEDVTLYGPGMPYGPSSLTNNGTLRTVGPGWRSIGIDVTNNAGATIQIDAPTFLGTWGSTTTNNGIVAIAASGVLNVDNSTFVSNRKSTLTVSGRATLTSSTFRQAGGRVTGSAVVLRGSTLDDSAGAGTFVLEGGWSHNTLMGTIPSGQTVTVQATAEHSSSTYLAGASVINKGVLRLASPVAGRFAALNDAPLINNGTLLMMPGSGERYVNVPVTNNAQLTVNATTHVQGGPSFPATLVNNHTVRLAAGVDLLFGGGSFTNSTSGTVLVTVSPAKGPGGRISVVGGAAAVSLAGTLEVVTSSKPVLGRIYFPVTADSLSGTFSSVTFRSAPYQVTYSDRAVNLASCPATGCV